MNKSGLTCKIVLQSRCVNKENERMCKYKSFLTVWIEDIEYMHKKNYKQIWKNAETATHLEQVRKKNFSRISTECI